MFHSIYSRFISDDATVKVVQYTYTSIKNRFFFSNVTKAFYLKNNDLHIATSK